uniref:Lysophospholipid acyltransferase family protein n=1 Tax=Roseihalotalea indica TaxID=2867963 RepID=A0AA49GNI7_9BACT|nr:lysophospholipid acyltransferase family protein [Tunicatimonas sp. TK19036]
MTWKKRIRKKVKYKILYQFIQGLFWLAAHVPRRWTLAIYESLGRIAYYIFPQERKRIHSHLQYALGSQAQTIAPGQFSRALFRNLAKNVADIFITRSFTTSDELDQFVNTEGFEHLEKAYKRGKGVIGLTCHMGAFELVGPNLSLRGYKTSIVGRKLKNPKMDQLLVDYRKHHGSKVIYSGEGVLKLVRALKKGEIIGLLIDQDIRWAKGLFVDFFGKPAYTPIGAAWLAQSTEAAVVPMAIRRLPNEQHVVTMLPELDISKTGDTEHDLRINTQRFSDALEQLIRMDLTQWVWMHERWKTKPEDITETPSTP